VEASSVGSGSLTSWVGSGWEGTTVAAGVCAQLDKSSATTKKIPSHKDILFDIFPPIFLSVKCIFMIPPINETGG
jgi:hypothetical protein